MSDQNFIADDKIPPALLKLMDSFKGAPQDSMISLALARALSVQLVEGSTNPAVYIELSEGFAQLARLMKHGSSEQLLASAFSEMCLEAYRIKGSDITEENERLLADPSQIQDPKLRKTVEKHLAQNQTGASRKIL